MAQAGRRPGPNRTRAAILAAASELFGAGGYAGTSVRAVATRAGVNQALVHHYFGTKQELFVAALRLPFDPVETIAGLLDNGPRTEFPERLVRRFIGVWRDPDTGPRMHAVVRSGIGTQAGGALLRGLAEEVVLARLSAELGVSPLRVAAAITHLIGLMIGATIIGVAPLAEASDDELAELVTPAIVAYLTP